MESSFHSIIFDESCNLSYQQILNHFSMLWQKYATRKNDARENKSTLNVDPRYFKNKNEPENPIYEDSTFLQLIRSNAMQLENQIDISNE